MSCGSWENSDSPEARFGSLIHAGIDEIIGLRRRYGYRLDAPIDVGGILEKVWPAAGVGSERRQEAEQLLGWFSRRDPHLDEFLASEIHFEWDAGPCVFEGTIDRLDQLNPRSEEPVVVRLTDYKSGWGRGEHLFQLRFYGYLVVMNIPSVQEVFFRVDYVRLPNGIIDVDTAKNDWEASQYRITREQLLNWWAVTVTPHISYLLETETGAIEPTGGSACKYCAKKALCPSSVQRTLGLIEDEGPTKYLEEIVRLKSGAEVLTDSLKEYLKERNPIASNGIEAGFFMLQSQDASSTKPRFAIRPAKPALLVS